MKIETERLVIRDFQTHCIALHIFLGILHIYESYSATIRGRQDVDIMPQISGRITRLCVKEGTRVTTGQVRSEEHTSELQSPS